MGDNDTNMTCPEHMRRAGFHPVAPDMAGRIIHVGMTNSKAFVKGELVVDDASGGATNPTTDITASLWKGVAAASGGSTVSLANAGVNLPVYVPAMWTEFFWAQAVSQPDAAHTDEIYDFTDKNTVNIAAAATAGYVGFKVYGWDPATTYYAVYGVFAVMGI